MPDTKDSSINPDELRQEITEAVERVRKTFRDMPKQESANGVAGEEAESEDK